MLCWFDEPPSALAACIAGLHIAGVDHVVACDGAYFLYPDGKPASPPDQAATIQQTAQALGIGATVYTPQHVWYGNEVEKRTRMFAIAHAASNPGDWWFSVDADMVVTKAPHDLKAQLEATDTDAARATLIEPRDLDDTGIPAGRYPYPRQGQYPIRLLFRAQPLHCQGNHCTYATPDGRILWSAQAPYGKEEPGIDILGLTVEHRNTRDMSRLQARDTYYQRRESIGVEREQVTA